MPARPKQMLIAGPRGWAAGPVDHGTGCRLRWKGLRGADHDHGLLLRTRSIHGFGLRGSLWAIALGPDLLVRSVGLLQRRGLVVDPAASWFLEIPCSWEPPVPGWRLMVELWPEH